MRKVLKVFTSQLRRVYFRLARPLLNLTREEREREHRQMQQELAAACQAVGAEATRLAKAREDVYAEMLRFSQGFVDYHETLTQKVADELTKMNRKLESLARAA
jgi:hypothetical protein